VARIGMIGLALLGLPGAIWPELLLGIFIHDPDTMAIATFPCAWSASAWRWRGLAW
jgi:multidrug resistance protein, MATE family